MQQRALARVSNKLPLFASCIVLEAFSLPAQGFGHRAQHRGLQEHYWTDSQDPSFWGPRKDSPSQPTLLVKVYTFSSGTSGKKTRITMEAIVRLRILSWPQLPRAQGCPPLLQRFHFNASTLVDHPPGVQWACQGAGFVHLWTWGSHVCSHLGTEWRMGLLLIESCSSKRYVEILTWQFL